MPHGKQASRLSKLSALATFSTPTTAKAFPPELIAPTYVLYVEAFSWSTTPSTSDLEQDVYPPRVKRIRFADKTYTSYGENVYVSNLKRIRLGHETYTFCPDKVYVSLIPIASRMLKVIQPPHRNPRASLYREELRHHATRWVFSCESCIFVLA